MQTENDTRVVSGTEARESVRRGCEYLDSKLTGWDWRRTLRAEELDLNSPTQCVLGQLNLTGAVLSTKSLGWLDEHGFWVLDGDRTNYDVLTAEWVRQATQLEEGAPIE